LVALSIMALISVMAYGGLHTVLQARQHVELQAKRMQQLQMALLFLGRDFQQLTERAIRDEFGDYQPALHSASHGPITVEFTHNGRRNPASQARSNLQRVAYGLQGDELLRWSWPVLDRAPDSTPEQQVILNEVHRFELRYLDTQLEWHEQWPPLQYQPGQPKPIPLAIEMLLELQDIGQLRRLFVLPDPPASLQSSAQENN
jgi:general secretion pathway protein J